MRSLSANEPFHPHACLSGGPTDGEDGQIDPYEDEIVVVPQDDPEVDLNVKPQIISPPKTRKGLVARSTALRAKEKISAPLPKVYCNPPKLKPKRGKSRR